MFAPDDSSLFVCVCVCASPLWLSHADGMNYTAHGGRFGKIRKMELATQIYLYRTCGPLIKKRVVKENVTGRPAQSSTFVNNWTRTRTFLFVCGNDNTDHTVTGQIHRLSMEHLTHMMIWNNIVY